MTRPRSRLVASLVMLVMLLAGAVLANRLEQMTPVRTWLIGHGLIEPRVGSRDDLQVSPQEVPCPTRGMVVLIAGQSNAANQGEAPKALSANVVNYYDGRCYRARDPLLGGSGAGGSIWSRLQWGGPVVLVMVAVGQSRVDEWQPGGRLWPRLTGPLTMLSQRGLPVTHILWHQGETDAMDATRPVAYRKALERMVRGLQARTAAKIYLAVGTHCHGVSNPALVTARDAVVKVTGVMKGPDTDRFDNSFRKDGCHLDNRGQAAVAKLWQTVLAPDLAANANLIGN